MRIRCIRTISLLILGLAFAGVTSAQGISKRVKFAKGKSSATFSGGIVRGDRDTYLVGAKAGQKMSVKISSLEKNAVFQIQGSRDGKYLKNASETDDQTNWSGTLPDDGDYKIIVGGTRGNASYKLSIAIR